MSMAWQVDSKTFTLHSSYIRMQESTRALYNNEETCVPHHENLWCQTYAIEKYRHLGVMRAVLHHHPWAERAHLSAICF